MATSRNRLPILSFRAIHAASGQTITAVRLWVELAFTRHGGSRHLRRCLLDTGAPISVIPYSVHRSQNLAWQTLPGPWPAGFTSWLGVPCEIGRIQVWVPHPGGARFHGPWDLIAKFALANPPNQPANLPVLLGLNFLQEQRADTRFRCHAVRRAGPVSLAGHSHTRECT